MKDDNGTEISTEWCFTVEGKNSKEKNYNPNEWGWCNDNPSLSEVRDKAEKYQKEEIDLRK